jgi:Ca-activated chloride channel family protein
LQCPLTIDDTAFRQSVESLNVNTIPEGGTSLSEAIQTAQSAFKEGDNHRILVLMTDGEDQDSGAVEAAKKAAQAGLRIYTIGIGTTDGELLRIKDPQGNTDYVRDEQGNVVKSHLNEDLLREIAGATEGGFYLPLRGAKTMDTLYEEGLAKLPKSEHQQKLVKQFEERYHWPLACAILLLVIEILIPERKRAKATAAVALPSGKTSVGTASLLLLLAFLAGNVAASPASALREYRSGNYEEAFKDYEALLKKKSDDPRLHFNAGAAAYRTRKFEEAAKEFDAAIATPDLKLQALAYYNRANAQYWIGEKNEDPSKRSEVWQKAVQDYDSSLKLNPQDADAKFNRDLVKKKLEELKQQQQKQNDQKNIQPSEAAKQAKAKADEAVRQRDYTKALDIMQKQLEQDETTAYYSDYINRLKEVTGVQDSAKR